MKVLITLDYELFMGQKTGSVENCLLSPMNSFISMLDRYGVKATVFVDAAYLLRLNELKDKYHNLKSDFELISSHLRCLEQDGHDVQLHFHPQWIYSDYDSKQWIMDFEHYKLSDLPESVLIKSFCTAKLLLEEIIGKKVIAFRAGGYSLPTYSGYIDLFKSNGIKIDSSVLRGARVDSKYQKYDYRNIPNDSIYNFSNSLFIEDNKGQFCECSISTVAYQGFAYWVLKRKLSSNYHPTIEYGDGYGIGISGSRLNRLVKRIKMLFQNKIVSASIDGFMSHMLLDIYSIHKKQTSCNGFVIIGHPKNFSNVSIRNVEEFILKVRAEDPFLTISSIK